MIATATIKRESIACSSTEEWLKLRAHDITSTEVPALFGLSPYVTPFELWHRKRSGNVVEIEQNERMKWGTRLQDSIALGIAEDQKWKVSRRAEYGRLPELRLGASFDFTIINEVCGRVLPTNVRCDESIPCPHHGTEFAENGGEKGLLEIKNVDPLVLRDEWVVEDEEVEAPPHIEMQVQHQLLVSGLPYAYIGALIGGNRSVLIRREPAAGIFDSILERAEGFWKSIDQGKEPKPDFSRDADFITKLYRAVRPGSVVDVAKDAEAAALVAKYKASMAARDAAETMRKEHKARLLMKIGDAEKATGEGWSISASAIKSTRVEAYDRAAYRDFRVIFKKSK